MTNSNSPRRGEIRTVQLGNPPTRHWVLGVSLDARNFSERVDSVLLAQFGGQGADGPTTLRFEPGETRLPAPSWLKGHFISTLKKSLLGERLPKALSGSRMRAVSLAIQRAVDPNA